jgi:leucyl aminopeptidase
MTTPELSVSSTPALEIEADVLVLGVAKGDDGVRVLGGDLGLGIPLDTIGVTGAQDELRWIPSGSGKATSFALIGLGAAQPTADSLRYAAGSAARQLRGIASIAFALPAETDEKVLAVLEGAAIGAYAYTEYRSSTLESTKLPASRIVVLSDTPNGGKLVERATAVAEAMHTVRDLVNAPPSDLYPETFAAAAVELAANRDVEIDVLAEDELLAGGYGGILGVGQGSSRGPRMVKLSYRPASAGAHLALVGKGITFDSGGLSLKPPASMVGMKYDMTGAATVLAVVLAIARLELPVRVTGWLCLAENLPSGTAIRPNDILRIRGGKTVEVLNTDAEGRLVLADGLVAASEEQPDAIIDVATLTGAARVALGNRFSGVMGDRDLVDRVVASGDRTGEQLWAMPIPDEVRPLLNSDVADIANAKPGETGAGMLMAASFLREFVGTTGEGDEKRAIPWAHIDIAGPANNGAAGWGFTGKGPTGVTVRALIELAEDFGRAV